MISWLLVPATVPMWVWMLAVFFACMGITMLVLELISIIKDR